MPTDATDQVLNVQIPGDPVASPDAAPFADDASAARIAELEATVSQLNALVSELNGRLQGVATVPAPDAAPIGVRRIIGENWGDKTAAEAQAAGVTYTVLCSDGYYVPGG